MNIIQDETCHIYNQGNNTNREQIFYEDADYLEYLNLFRKYVLPNCDVLAYRKRRFLAEMWHRPFMILKNWLYLKYGHNANRYIKSKGK